MAKVDEILRQFYYHNPDELGEDAFNNLGDDEVAEVKQALYKDLLELIGEDEHINYHERVTTDEELVGEARNQLRQELRDKLKDYFGITE